MPLGYVALIAIACAAWLYAPARFIAEDSYFYLVTARRFALEGQPSFSGVFITNGVHPLHFWLLSLYSLLVARLDPAWLWNPACALPYAALCVGVGLWGFARAEATLGLRRGVWVVPPLVFVTAMGVLYSEAHVSYAALGLWLRFAALDACGARVRRAFAGGVLLGCVLLARLDSVFFGVAVAAFWTVRERRAWALVAGLLLVVVPYVISNELIFGGATPISGFLKSTFPRPLLRGIVPGESPLMLTVAGYSLLFGWLPVTFSLWVAARGRLRRSRELQRVGWPLLVGSCGHLLYNALFATWNAWYWYFVLPVVCGAFFLAVELTARPRWTANLVLGASLAFYAVIWLRARQPAEQTSELQRTAARFGLEHSTLLVSELPGGLAYASHARVIAADLLTGNQGLYRALKASDNALTYLLDAAASAGRPVEYILWMGGDFLVWDRAQQELVYLDPKRTFVDHPIGRMHVGPPLYSNADSSLVLWKLHR